jgi:hypothetical protein
MGILLQSLELAFSEFVIHCIGATPSGDDSRYNH